MANKAVMVSFLLFMGWLMGCQTTPTPTPTAGVTATLPPTTTAEPSLTPSATPEPILTATPSATPTATTTPNPLGQLVVSSNPAGATISLWPNELTATAPITWELRPGSYTVTVILEGYEPWTEVLTVTAGETVSTTAVLHKPYTFVPIVDPNGPLYELQWDAKTQTIFYALQDEQWPAHVQFLATYQNWWQYNLNTGENSPLPRPQSQLSNAVREQLGICPFPLPETVPYAYNCRPTLFESPINNKIIYSSGQTESEFNTWLANNDGSEAIYLEPIYGAPQKVIWSNDGLWVLIGIWSGNDGNETYFLASTDGKIVESLGKLTQTNHSWVYGVEPRFSPDSTKLAFVGVSTQNGQHPADFEMDSYDLYLLDLPILKLHKISEEVGAIQWTADSQGLYLFAGSATTETYTSENHPADLYLIKLDELQAPQLIASNIPNAPPLSKEWIYLPEENVIVGRFYGFGYTLGLLFLK